jgi:hypothetical protein
LAARGKKERAGGSAAVHTEGSEGSIESLGAGRKREPRVACVVHTATARATLFFHKLMNKNLKSIVYNISTISDAY